MSEFVEIDIQPDVDSGPEVGNYTDSHFMNKLNEELENIRNSQMSRVQQRLIENDSNSPISMSNPSSDSDNDDCFEEGYLSEENLPASSSSLKPQLKSPLKKLTFREVRDSIYKYYETDDKYSNELDILSTYLKGQQHVLLKAADTVYFKSHIVLFPAVMGSFTISIFSLVIECSRWSGPFLSGLNAFVFILYFVNIYFKMEASAILYRQWAKQYDKLSLDIADYSETDKHDFVLDKLRDMEKKFLDLKETMIISLPYEIKNTYPILFNVQIFSFIKRIELYKKNLIVKFKDIKNEIRYILWKWDENTKGKARLNFLCRIKEKIKDEILHYNNAYGSLDELMTKEMKRSVFWFALSKRMNTANPVVASYFSSIFEDD